MRPGFPKGPGFFSIFRGSIRVIKMSSPRTCFLIVFFLLFFCAPGFAQRNSYTTLKIPDNSIRIDADASENAWDKVEWSGNYIQTEPYDSVAPTQNTSFKTIYDNEAVYFLIRAYDSAPDSIERQMCRRDGSASRLDR